MKRVLTLLAVMMVLLGVMAAPVAAHEPVVFEDSVTFQDFDPCTGELQTITINFRIWLLEDEDSVVARVRRTGHTDGGYVMAHGWETFFASDGLVQNQFEDPWNHPETGHKFGAAGRFLEVDGEVLVNDFVLICLK